MSSQSQDLTQHEREVPKNCNLHNIYIQCSMRKLACSRTYVPSI